MLINQGLLKEEVQIEEAQNGGESVLSRKRVVEQGKRQIELCQSKVNMPLQMAEKERVFI